MYKYLKLDTEYYQGLVEALGKESIRDIIVKQVPLNFEQYTRQIEEGINEKNYDKIRRAVHTIKSDFRHFIPVKEEFILFVQDFENRAQEKQEEQENGRVEQHVDFTPDLIKLKAISKGPLEEIKLLGEEYKDL